MKVELLNPKALKDGLKILEIAGRTCYDSEVKDDPTPFISRIIQSGHLSVIEHVNATFLISGISRACSHQLVRHRLASYSQRSQRYVKEDGFEYVTPGSLAGTPFLDMYYELMHKIGYLYERMISEGIPKEDARFILPNACATKLVMTMNLRELRHFLTVRLAKNAQWEIRDLAEAIMEIIYGVVPVAVEDIRKTYVLDEFWEEHKDG